MNRLLAAIALAISMSILALSGCAHGGRANAVALGFPADFSLLQVVAVEQGEVKMDFLASLRRQGEAFELSMLDPVLQRPIYEAHTDARGRLVETRPLPDEARGLGAMLFESLRRFFAAEAFERAGEALVFRGDRFLFEFEPWDAGAACPFPAEIRMRTRGGPAMRVTARTEDVVCGDAPSPSPSTAP